MLTTNDVVKVADTVDKEKTKYYGEFERPYFTFGPQDQIESEVKEIPTVDNGVVRITVTAPKADKSTAETVDLVQQAVDYLKSQQETKDGVFYVEKESDRRDPYLILLSLAEDALANKLRMAKYNQLKPTVIDYDKSLEKHAKALMARKPGKFANLEAAIKALRDLGM